MSSPPPPQSPPSHSTWARWLAGSLAVAAGLFLLTGLFDYLYLRSIISEFEQGLGAVEWINPHLGKAVVALVSGIVTVLFFRMEAMSPRPMARYLSQSIAVGFFIAAVTHGIRAAATWGDLFDRLGQSELYYGIDDSNEVRYFTHPGVHPRTGEPLIKVTVDNVREVELWRHTPFAEVRDPAQVEWFARRNARPMLWFVEREDGLHFFNMPGYDAATAKKLEPVTPEMRTTYLASKTAAAQAAEQRQAEAAAARERAKRDAEIAEEERRVVIRKQLEGEEARKAKIAQEQHDREAQAAEAQRQSEMKQQAEAEKRRKAAELAQQREEDEHQNEAMNHMKAGPVTAGGGTAVEAFWLQNATREKFQFQILTPTGWKARTIGPGEKQFFSANYEEKIRWQEKGSYRLESITVYVQPYYSFNGYDLNSLKQRAPTQRISANGDGTYQLEHVGP
jgi:hypothetical protein